ncbi:hypothetical protein [Modestobacter versicolor]|uniref:hypothetical protein n=1 Tax=Modestobacter versicolor TaxID=429133 RepID=UPI0034DF841E
MSTAAPRAADPYLSDPRRPATSALTPWWRWLFLLPGLAAVLYGVRGLLTAGGRVPLDSWLTWFVGSALLSDLVITPVWIALGWLSTRLLPRAARPAAVVGAAVSGVLTLVALPFVLGKGYDPANPSFLPRDYGQTLLVLVLVVLAVSAVVGTVAVLRERRRS